MKAFFFFCHYAWIVSWTSSQLFVPRLNEKCIPDLWIKWKPPFSSSLSPVAIVFTYWLVSKQTNKQKKEIHTKEIHQWTYSWCWTFKDLRHQLLVEQDFLTPRSSFQCPPTSQVSIAAPSLITESRHSASRRSNSGQSHITPVLRLVDVHHSLPYSAICNKSAEWFQRDTQCYTLLF